jgi:hypothetical protein
MRAKVQVGFIQECFWGADKTKKTAEILSMHAVCKNKYDETGLDEDNTFAIMSPSADFKLTIANPVLFEKFAVGDKMYVDFSAAE